MTTGDVQAHLAEVYGTNVSRQQISTITDAVVEKMGEWQNRPLDAVYPVVFIDAINVKIRDGQVANRPIYVALAVTCQGTREVLGLWAGEHGDGEGAKYSCCGAGAHPAVLGREPAALPAGARRRLDHLRLELPAGRALADHRHPRRAGGRRVAKP